MKRHWIYGAVVVVAIASLVSYVTPAAPTSPWLRRPFFIRFLNYVGSLPLIHSAFASFLTIEEDNMIREAVFMAGGLTDFGEPEYPMREGLRALVRSLNEDTNLTAFGSLIARQIIVQHMTQRLQMIGAIQANPSILLEEIRAPIIIVGAPRTCSTFLYHLLSEDPANRAPMAWELLKPWPAPNATDEQAWTRDWRRWRVELELQIFKLLIPNVDSLHRFGAEIPTEEIVFHSQQFKSMQWPIVFDCPSYIDWLVKTLADQDGYMPYHRDMLKYFQHGGMCPQCKRWVLKTPDHVPRVRELLKTYPSAKIVWTHRNPANVMSSIASLTSYFVGSVQDHVDPKVIGSKLLDLMTVVFQKAVEDRKRMTTEENARIYDVHFGDCLSDPVGLVKNIYAYFNIEMSLDAQQRITAFATDHRKGSKPTHKHDVSSFGWEKSELLQRFQFYADYFNATT